MACSTNWLKSRARWKLKVNARFDGVTGDGLRI
jgi:hypothetical protein